MLESSDYHTGSFTTELRQCSVIIIGLYISCDGYVGSATLWALFILFYFNGLFPLMSL